MINIPRPCKNEIDKYIKRWNNTEKNVIHDNILYKIFNEYHGNEDVHAVLIKTSLLNSFYSTNIYSIFDMAKHIQSLNIDEKLKCGDASIVSQIAEITIRGKRKFFYSFATKYCSHHNETAFPIYDEYVKRVLMHFKKKDKFAKFKVEDLKDYSSFKSILLEFIQFYSLNECGFKNIDRYLWQVGKEYFSKYE